MTTLSHNGRSQTFPVCPTSSRRLAFRVCSCPCIIFAKSWSSNIQFRLSQCFATPSARICLYVMYFAIRLKLLLTACLARDVPAHRAGYMMAKAACCALKELLLLLAFSITELDFGLLLHRFQNHNYWLLPLL